VDVAAVGGNEHPEGLFNDGKHRLVRRVAESFSDAAVWDVNAGQEMPTNSERTGPISLIGPVLVPSHYLGGTKSAMNSCPVPPLPRVDVHMIFFPSRLKTGRTSAPGK
jgi:hypothetical protein